VSMQAWTAEADEVGLEVEVGNGAHCRAGNQLLVDQVTLFSQGLWRLEARPQSSCIVDVDCLPKSAACR